MMSGMKRRSGGGSLRETLANRHAMMADVGAPSPKRTVATAAPAAPVPTTMSRPVSASPRAGIENVGGVGVMNPPRDVVAKNMQMQEMETTGALKRRSR